VSTLYLIEERIGAKSLEPLLNWPTWKKELIAEILCLGSILNAGTNVASAETPLRILLCCAGTVPQRLILSNYCYSSSQSVNRIHAYDVIAVSCFEQTVRHLPSLNTQATPRGGVPRGAISKLE
jgi:hypothetical protein